MVGGGETRVGVLLAQDAAALLNLAELKGGRLHFLELEGFPRPITDGARQAVVACRVLRKKKDPPRGDETG